MARFTHPPATPAMPWFQGSSDLSGEYGDLLYGTTKRSKNVRVKDGASTATRGGLERAFDAQYQGNARLLTRRSGSGRFVLLGDGEGVHALTSLPSSKYPGIGGRHSGFAVDYFNRANSGSLTTSGNGSYWLEGKDSVEIPSWTADDNSSVVSNQCRFTRTAASIGTIDWVNEAVTAYYFSQWHLDLDALTLASFGNKTDIFFFMNLPRERIKPSDGSTFRERMFAIDAWRTFTSGGESVCWSGLACRLRIERMAAGDIFRLQISLAEFLTNRQSHDVERQNSGRIDVLAEKWTTTNFTAAEYKGNWLLSFGRERETSNKWKIKASLWRNKTMNNYLAGDLKRSDADADLVRSGRSLDQGTSFTGWYRSLHGSGGHAGAVIQFQNGTGTVGVDAVDITFGDLA